MNAPPAPDLLRRLLAYVPKTGKLFWLIRPLDMFPCERTAKSWNTKYAGTEAFARLDREGYTKGTLLGRTYQGHRVAWAIYNGEWPSQQIDHVNHNRADNRIANLRDVPRQINSRNAKLSRNNSTGANGIHQRRNGKYAASIGIAGQVIHLGHFRALEEAVAERAAADRTFGFHQNHGRSA